MGLLTIAPGASVYVDANVLIYGVERIEPYATLLHPLWNASKVNSAELIASELLIIEALTGPIKHGNTGLIDVYEQIFRANDPRLLGITQSILTQAARIRAGHGLKTPDAIHAATALEARCTMFLTNDVGFRRVPGLPVMLLDDVLKS